MAVIIIAEIGECWNGDMEQALKLIDVAREAGCDFAKFQTLDRDGIAADDPEREWFLKLALDKTQLSRLIERCNRIGIGFLATPEKLEQAKVLKELGCDEVKIASSCLVDDELLTYINGRFRKVFISTGLASLQEVDHAVNLLNKTAELFIFHCIAEYPTGPLLEKRGLRALDDRDVHLSMMRVLQERYPAAAVGYSDHTVGLLAPFVAVAAGARVIEKHITLDRKRPVANFNSNGPYLGTDHVLSLEPAELRELVAGIRKVEEMLGPVEWKRTPGEIELRSFLRERFRQ